MKERICGVLQFPEIIKILIQALKRCFDLFLNVRFLTARSHEKNFKTNPTRKIRTLKKKKSELHNVLDLFLQLQSSPLQIYEMSG